MRTSTEIPKLKAEHSNKQRRKREDQALLVECRYHDGDDWKALCHELSSSEGVIPRILTNGKYFGNPILLRANK